MSLDDLAALFEGLPRKPRYVNDAPRTVHELTRIVVLECGGDASGLWVGKAAAETKRTLQSIYGVGPGMASMALLLIERAFDTHFPESERHAMDLKPDVHTTRVLYRLGVFGVMTEQAAVQAAREVNPSFPGEIDAVLWDIGRSWCYAEKPARRQCAMKTVCQRVDVRG